MRFMYVESVSTSSSFQPGCPKSTVLLFLDMITEDEKSFGKKLSSCQQTGKPGQKLNLVFHAKKRINFVDIIDLLKVIHFRYMSTISSSRLII